MKKSNSEGEKVKKHCEGKDKSMFPYKVQAVTCATPRDLRITLHAFQISASPYGDHTKDFAFEVRVCVTVCVKGATVTHWKLKEIGGMFCHCTGSVNLTR